MKPSKKTMFSAGIAAAAAVAIAIPVANAAAGPSAMKNAPIPPIGTYTAGSVPTTCTIGTPVAVGPKKVSITFTVTAGTGTVKGILSTSVDLKGKVAGYQGVAKTQTFGGLVTGSAHTVHMHYSPANFKSIYQGCSATYNFSF